MQYNLEHEASIERKVRHPAGLPPSSFKTIFVLSDVFTFLAQTAGGLMQIFDSVAKIGRIVVDAGIAAQMASFVLFTFLWASFAYRV